MHNPPALVTQVELSNHTAPGRLGFSYALEFNLGIYQQHFANMPRKHQRRTAISSLGIELSKRWGKPYQTHWERKQLSKRWYQYHISNPQRIRICFKTENDRTLAAMLYKI
jgi:hypothetical protein